MNEVKMEYRKKDWIDTRKVKINTSKHYQSLVMWWKQKEKIEALLSEHQGRNV